ncbi:Uncharacterized protein YbcI [Alkalicoccus daliensis]|uniref:Uncharacterized protein YbcI n=1 Tax=Alkalicoccus daliensis TaxID=745820 RepID=A0A1H0DXI5_9BACI|nr:Uncharacterized protein YbcI [Alkalicoccus daliensis]
MREVKKTKGQLEMALSVKITQWEKEYLGRGSLSCKCELIRDMALITLAGVLTPAEYQMAESIAGRDQIKKFRNDLVESGRKQVEEMVNEVFGLELISLHTDISTKTGERLIVLKFNKPWDQADNA